MDARGVGFLWTPDEIRQIAEMVRRLNRKSPFGPTGVLVSTDAAFGVMRTMETLIEDFVELKPFRDELEARAWLASKSLA